MPSKNNLTRRRVGLQCIGCRPRLTELSVGSFMAEAPFRPWPKWAAAVTRRGRNEWRTKRLDWLATTFPTPSASPGRRPRYTLRACAHAGKNGVSLPRTHHLPCRYTGSKALYEDVVHEPPAPVHRHSPRTTELRLVNWEPWSSGVPPRSASSSCPEAEANLMVFESRHDRTRLVRPSPPPGRKSRHHGDVGDVREPRLVRLHHVHKTLSELATRAHTKVRLFRRSRASAISPA